MPRRKAAKATARYIAPVSRYSQAEAPGHGLPDGALAGAGRAVDGDDQRDVTRTCPGAALVVAGAALHADDGALVELGEVGGAGVRARRAHAGDDLVEDVLDARPLRVEVHPRRADALLEQLLAGPLEDAVGPACGA